MEKFCSIMLLFGFTIFIVGIIIGPIGAATNKEKLDNAGKYMILSGVGLFILTGLIYAWYKLLTT